MKKIVITGATGMIGSNLARYALEKGCEVLCVVRPDSSKESNIPLNPRLRVLYSELSGYGSIQAKGQYDAFYHFAWDKTFGSSRDDVDIQLKNIQYTLDAVRLAHRFGCKVFVGAGSQAEYGPVSSDLRPDTPANPLSGYGIAKYAAGKLSALLCSQLGIRQNWVRILSVYGVLDNPYTLIMYAIDTLLKGEKPSLTGCAQIWDYINETDAASAFFALSEKGIGGKSYPLGSGEGRRLSAYIEDIRNAIDPGLPLGFGEKEYFPNQPMHLCADISELKADTGWAPRVNFSDGIKSIVGRLAALKNREG